MSDPFRLRVMKAITAALKTITTTNGYLHDMADWTVTENGADAVKSRVFRGRQWYGAADPVPMISVLEHPQALDPNYAAAYDATDRIGEWDLLIQGFVTDDPENPTDPAHLLVADVIKCLAAQTKGKTDDGGPNILGLGYREPCVSRLSIGSQIVRPADGVNSDFAFFWLTVTLKLVEDVENPFA